MRLIDADELKNLPWINDRGAHDCGEEFVYLSAIDRSPTIEAIPVEWINKYIADDTNGRQIELLQVSMMLRRWKEEHETG